MTHTIEKDIRLAQLCDSAFPIGAFAFSNGLESAIEYGIIKNCHDLKLYTRTIVEQALNTDIIAALHSHRALCSNSYEQLYIADSKSYINKISAEARGMTIKMGKRCAEMANLLYPENKQAAQWLNDIETNRSYGCYNISAATLYYAAGMDEQSLFAGLVYGVINTTLNAALRVFRISHKETQKIILELSSHAMKDYLSIKDLELEDMQSFTPECDIIASLHEYGIKRMFAN